MYIYIYMYMYIYICGKNIMNQSTRRIKFTRDPNHRGSHREWIFFAPNNPLPRRSAGQPWRHGSAQNRYDLWMNNLPAKTIILLIHSKTKWSYDICIHMCSSIVMIH